MMSPEHRARFARLILDDLERIDRYDVAQRIETVANRIGAAILEHQRLSIEAPTVDPKRRAEAFQLYCTLAGAVGRQPEKYHEVKDWADLVEMVLAAHDAFRAGIAAVPVAAAGSER